MNNFWTLVRFELKKILSRKITWIAFGIVFTVMLFFGFYRAIVSHEVDGMRITAHEEEMQAKAEIKKIAGRQVNDELVADMLSAVETDAFASYEVLYKELVGDLCGNVKDYKSLTDAKVALGVPAEDDIIYTMRQRGLEKSFDGQKLSEGEKAYWLEKLEQSEFPWTYEYYKGPDFAWVAAYTAIVLIALMIAVSLANLFADEHQKKTDQLVLCSRNGKKVLYRAKITAGMLFTVVSSGLVLFVTAVPQLIMFGTDGLHAPIQLMAPKSLIQMTFGQMIIYTYVISIIASMLYAAITMCCSELFRNSTVAVMALITVLVLVPMIVMVPYEYRVLSQIFDLNPINVIAIWSATDYRLVPFFGTYLNVYQVAPVLYVFLILVFGFVGGKAYKRYQVSGR